MIVLKKITKTEDLAYLILSNILDPVSKRRIILVLRGAQDTGKSTIIEWLRDLMIDRDEKGIILNKYVSSLILDDIISGKRSNELIKSKDNLLLYCHEIDSTVFTKTEAIKTLSIGDYSSTRAMYNEAEETKSIASFVFGTNGPLKFPPEITLDNGIKRRILALNVPEPIMDNPKEWYVDSLTETSKNLKMEIISGVLNWIEKNKNAVEGKFGYVNYQKFTKNKNINEIYSYITSTADIEKFINLLYIDMVNRKNIPLNKPITFQYYFENSSTEPYNQNITLSPNDFKDSFLITDSGVYFNKKKLYQYYKYYRNINGSQKILLEKNFSNFLTKSLDFEIKKNCTSINKIRQTCYYIKELKEINNE